MATVNITIPNALVPRLTAAMNGVFPETVGQDPATAFKAITAAYWQGVLAQYETREAEKAAQAANVAAIAAARAKAETDGAGIA